LYMFLTISLMIYEFESGSLLTLSINIKHAS
jgi:hypothetical protein